MYETLLPLMQKTRTALSPEEFHEAVNVVFHDVEAATYDSIHSDMRESLQLQMELLIADALQKTTPKNSLHLLDIGCGTGLSTDLLLKTALGASITKITLLDTSGEMLSKAKITSQKWQRDVDFHHGTIEDLDSPFDVILVCSVLHHIPDLQRFLKKVSSVQPAGGILVHLQDPNGDHLDDKHLKERSAKASQSNSLKSAISKFIPAKIKSTLRGRNYIDEVNDRLFAMGVIVNPMSPAEIWSVTDIHVDNLPYSIGRGISYSALLQELGQYEPAGFRSYGFFSKLESDLAPDLRLEERRFINQSAQDGRFFGAAWIKKNNPEL